MDTKPDVPIAMGSALAVAERLVHQGLGALSILAGAAPADVTDEFYRVARGLVAELTPADRAGDVAGYAALFTRGAPMLDEHLAAAKLLLSVEVAARALLDSYYVSGRFPGSRLLDHERRLHDRLDDDGLLPAAAFEVLPDAFRLGRTVVYPSELVPVPLARVLCTLARERPETVRFQPSHYTVGDIDGYGSHLWEEFWRGPRFDFDKFRNTRLNGASEHTELRRVPRDRIEGLFAAKDPVVAVQVGRTERRDTREPISLLVEELAPASSSGFTRTTIFHCDIRPGGERFIHADASVLLYDAATYARRLAAPQGEKVKAQGHYKLFKVVDVDRTTWTNLLLQSFPRDELIVEYLTGERQPIGPTAG